MADPDMIVTRFRDSLRALEKARGSRLLDHVSPEPRATPGAKPIGESAAPRKAAATATAVPAHHQTSGVTLEPQKNLVAVAHNHGAGGAFHHVRDEIHAANERIVHKAFRGVKDHDHLRALHDAVGSRATGLALDALGGSHMGRILRAVDPHHQHDGTENGMRSRLRDLASGAASPAAAAAGTKRRRSRAPAAVPETHEFSRSMGAKAGGLRTAMTARPGGED